MHPSPFYLQVPLGRKVLLDIKRGQAHPLLGVYAEAGVNFFDIIFVCKLSSRRYSYFKM